MNDPAIRQRNAGVWLGLTAAGAMLVGLSVLSKGPASLVWNVSDSMPTGLYRVQGRAPQRGDIVLASLPEVARLLATDRRILSAGTPVLKTVAAMPSDTVCRHGQTVSINSTSAARALWRDAAGRPMPVWSGCRRLVAEDVFLLASHPKSFDGRYFGTITIEEIIGVAVPLWTLAHPIDQD